jgi:CelD/BcsL family acetyltransferase involved in cellulose biosynthesis
LPAYPGAGGSKLYQSPIHAPEEDIRRPAGRAALALGWERLGRFAALPTQSADFIAALAETMLAAASIRLFEAAGPEGLDAMLPLCRDPGRFARWRMPGAREVFEPGDALCRDAAAAERLAHLIIADGRAVDLARIPANSRLIPALKAAMKGRGRLSVRPAAPSPTIALDGTWHEPENHFNSRRRSDFRRAARRAREFGVVRCEMLAPTPEAFDALFDEAIAVEAKSWKRSARTAIACDPAKEAFFRHYLRAACARGEGRVAFLRIDERVVAMQLGVEWAGRYWLFKIGYDEAYARCSPGTLLMLHALGDAAERGLTGFELMGDAEAWIADLWTRETHECVRLRTYPYTIAGLPACLRDVFTWGLSRLRRRAR